MCLPIVQLWYVVLWMNLLLLVILSQLLYNRLGFKTERFVVGFYEEYLRKDSKASKNAFLLRLRQQ